jgi:hypothetical protein
MRQTELRAWAEETVEHRVRDTTQHSHMATTRIHEIKACVFTRVKK